jgi:multidrug efflux pump subunit AcrA (membrane-fusion protein)
MALFAMASAFAGMILCQSGCSRDENESLNSSQNSTTSSNAAAESAVELSGNQLDAIKIAPVERFPFSVEKNGIGSIDFENNLYSDASLSTPVFPPGGGIIETIFVELGDEVQKGDLLFSMETSGTNLTVRSPIAGQITSVNATPGLSVSASNAPAPVSVADVSKKWLLANVSEADAPLYRVGQSVKVSVASFPSREFDGNISKIYPTVDATTHRLTIRATISDPANELRAGMLADFSVYVQQPVESVAIPENGVVREGDGTMTAWVTTDKRHFTQRIITTGLRENGRVQILHGLKTGELAVADGAIFLDNMLQTPSGD